jgi:hypothetical protein
MPWRSFFWAWLLGKWPAARGPTSEPRSTLSLLLEAVDFYVQDLYPVGERLAYLPPHMVLG